MWLKHTKCVRKVTTGDIKKITSLYVAPSNQVSTYNLSLSLLMGEATHLYVCVYWSEDAIVGEVSRHLLLCCITDVPRYPPSKRIACASA